MLEKINRVAVISQGEVEGIPAGDPTFTVFRGIPYAADPVGELRWKPAVSAPAWKGRFFADQWPKICVQGEQVAGSFYQKEFYPRQEKMGEDSLALNIWTPEVNKNKRLPVLFWIHGGAFSGGYSFEKEFDGEVFCRRDCILVTTSYRLGIFGFLAHPELTARDGTSGNYGLTDLVCALNWVRDNISAFGGDPERVTIFGQSAGGAMVRSLLVCPQAKGLFRRAIIHSSVGIMSIGKKLTFSDAENFGVELCRELGKSIDELKRMPAILLRDCVSSVMRKSGRDGMWFHPYDDGIWQPKDTEAAVAHGEIHDVELMMGSVEDDWGLFCGDAQNMEQYHTVVESFGDDAEEYDRIFDVKSPADLPRFTQKIRAFNRVVPLAWAEKYAVDGRKPIYTYFFDRKMPGDTAGAFHSSELWYVFGTLNRCWRSPFLCGGDYAISLAMSAYWANFARSGDPNGDGLPTWEPYLENAHKTMYLNEREIVCEAMDDDPFLREIMEIQIKK